MLNSVTKATIGTTSRQLFRELAMHHHNYIVARRFNDEKLPVQRSEDQAHYFQLLVSQNKAMLALTLCKVMEFHNAFCRHLASDLKDELSLINTRLARSRILEYRNKCVGHLFDRATQKPLPTTAILSYWEALLDGQSEYQFKSWWWSARQDAELKSVAGTMVRIADFVDEC